MKKLPTVRVLIGLALAASAVHQAIYGRPQSWSEFFVGAIGALLGAALTLLFQWTGGGD